jgi:hypothetical protein
MLDVSHMTELRSSGSSTKRQRQTPNLELRGGVHRFGVGVWRSHRSPLRVASHGSHHQPDPKT